MRSAQVDAPKTHGAIDIQSSIDPMLEQLNDIRRNCDQLQDDDREEMFAAVEEARSLINSISTAFTSLLPKVEDTAQVAASA
jgi:hypothetical protein